MRMLNAHKKYSGQGNPRPVGTVGHIALVAALSFAAAAGLEALRKAGSAGLRQVAEAHVSVHIEAPHFTLNIQWKD